MRWGVEEADLDFRSQGRFARVRVVLRGGLVGAVTYSGLVILLLIRIFERPFFHVRRPITPWITRGVCRFAFWGMGMPLCISGKPMQHHGAIVANHASWLDIFALNAMQNIYFVAKSEVAGWVGIGWLARATGTEFIARKSSQAAVQRRVFEDRLNAGHRLVFFPEGTSSDGLRVLPFKSTLFAAFFEPELKRSLWVQPVSVVYHAPEDQEPRFYGWWGDMDFAPHLLRVLGQSPQGRVEVIFHDPLKVDEFSDRKVLAQACEDKVRSGLRAALEHAI